MEDKSTQLDLDYWGYLHCNGKPQLKRWYGDHKDYTEDCEDNDFVLQVVRPFKAADRDAAMKILLERLGLPVEQAAQS